MEEGREASKPLSEVLAEKEPTEDGAQIKKTPNQRGRRKKAETAPKEQAAVHSEQKQQKPRQPKSGRPKQKQPKKEAQKSPKKKSGITCELPVYLL